MPVLVRARDIGLVPDARRLDLDPGPFHGAPLEIDDRPAERHVGSQPDRGELPGTALPARLQGERVRFRPREARLHHHELEDSGLSCGFREPRRLHVVASPWIGRRPVPPIGREKSLLTPSRMSTSPTRATRDRLPPRIEDQAGQLAVLFGVRPGQFHPDHQLAALDHRFDRVGPDDGRAGALTPETEGTSLFGQGHGPEHGRLPAFVGEAEAPRSLRDPLDRPDSVRPEAGFPLELEADG